MAHLDEHNLLSYRQHAFRKRHSCETQLTTVINDWAELLDNRGQIDTFILDFEKAFDTYPNELLKSKSLSYGIDGKTSKWIPFYASDNNELLQMEYSQTGPQSCRVPPRALFLVPCCSLFTLIYHIRY